MTEKLPAPVESPVPVESPEPAEPPERSRQSGRIPERPERGVADTGGARRTGTPPKGRSRATTDTQLGEVPHLMYAGAYAHDLWFTDLRRGSPAPVGTAVLWAALATGVLSMTLLDDGVGVNLFLVALPATLTAYFAARRAGRLRARPWTLAWGVGGIALLLVPALRAALWPSLLAVATAVGLASLALHGSRTWAGVVLSPFGLVDSLFKGAGWGWRGLRTRAGNASGNVGSALRVLVVTAVLLLVFGALFAGADAAFADLLSRLLPDMSVGDGPWRLVLFALGFLGALAAAHSAAAPLWWDSFRTGPGRARGRGEWALPLLLMCVLFAAFNAIQLAVLFGGYQAVLDKTGQTYSEYARQGFWQLLIATLLTLLVIVLALRWAPRGGPGDRNLVRGVLGTLCALTLIVVASAVRRMDMYVEAYGLTRLRISVVAVELWLGLVILLIMVAGVLGARRLPRAVAASARLPCHRRPVLRTPPARRAALREGQPTTRWTGHPSLAGPADACGPYGLRQSADCFGHGRVREVAVAEHQGGRAGPGTHPVLVQVHQAQPPPRRPVHHLCGAATVEVEQQVEAGRSPRDLKPGQRRRQFREQEVTAAAVPRPRRPQMAVVPTRVQECRERELIDDRRWRDGHRRLMHRLGPTRRGDHPADPQGGGKRFAQRPHERHPGAVHTLNGADRTAVVAELGVVVVFQHQPVDLPRPVQEFGTTGGGKHRSGGELVGGRHDDRAGA